MQLNNTYLNMGTTFLWKHPVGTLWNSGE